MRDLARALSALGGPLRWSDSASFQGLPPELVPELRQSGCVSLTLGIESASPSVLARMNRRYELTRAREVLHAANEAGIWLHANVITGFPGETRAEFEETARFVEEHAEWLDGLSVTPFYLVPSRMLLDPEAHGVRLREDASGGGGRHFDGSIAYDELIGDRLPHEENVAEARRREAEVYERYLKVRGRLREVNDILEVHDLASYLPDKPAMRDALRQRQLRLVLYTGAACPNDCVGCPFAATHPATRERPFGTLRRTARVARQAGYGRVLVVGGEPTLRPDLPALLGLLAELGFSDIELETDGSGLQTPEDARLVKRLGVTRVLLKAQGRTADVHDGVVRRAGAFDELRAAYRELRRAGLPTAQATPTWLGALSPCMGRERIARYTAPLA